MMSRPSATAWASAWRILTSRWIRRSTRFTGGAFSLAAEGLHDLYFKSVDLAGNAEVERSTAVAVDLTPPQTQLQVLGSSGTDSQGNLFVASVTSFSLSAFDPVSNGVASGVNTIYYLIDADPFSCGGGPPDPAQPPGTCDNQTYDGQFTLSAGTHTIYYLAEDNVANQEAVHVASVTVQLAVSTAAYPGDASYVNRQPNFGWIAPSTAALAVLGAGASYYLQVSNAQGFGPGDIVISVSTPAVLHAAVVPFEGAAYVSTFTLADATTFYWRVQSQDAAGATGPWSAIASFVTDFASPPLPASAPGTAPERS